MHIYMSGVGCVSICGGLMRCRYMWGTNGKWDAYVYVGINEMQGGGLGKNI